MDGMWSDIRRISISSTYMNPLMEKSLQHYNYLNAKKKATQEEDVKLEIPPFPLYKSADNLVNNLGWRNFLRSLTVKSKTLINNLKP